MVGTRTEPRYAGSAVSGARIQHFASMVRDANPAYWDSEFAQQVWGGIVAPPALLIGLLMPPPWLPTGEPPTASIAVRVPLPGTAIINASNVVEFLSPVLEGDRLSVVEEVVSVSPEKTTRLGAGHFIETLETYCRADGSPVAVSRNTLFRYTPAAKS
jgi:acyl dehydratase